MHKLPMTDNLEGGTHSVEVKKINLHYKALLSVYVFHQMECKTLFITDYVFIYLSFLILLYPSTF
ncbi:hypothetical protein BDB01DRAFT_511344 [Pilobolus umbonatus]|nr:hypothetical protein BDB01DRAFT_511344 [Pilobolus umbonatus]